MHGIERIQAAVRRHPRWADGGLAALLALLNASSLAGAGVVGWLLFGAAHVPLVWRRRAPVVVFWTIYVLAGLSVTSSPALAEGVYPETLVLVVVYTLALYRSRRWLWPALVVLEGTLLGAALLGDPRGGPWNSVVLGTCVLAATTLLGVTLSTRRAYLAALEERARRAERERDQRAQLAVATERARIAREVHDIVAHNLAVMVALADGAAFTAPVAPERAAGTMQQVSATGRQALAEMRRLLGLLREDRTPPAIPRAADPGQPPRPDSDRLSPQPGLDDLDRLIDQVRAAGIQVALTRHGTPGNWGPGAGLAVYRIVQEALTNTLKHAGPQASAHVQLHYTPTGVELEVADDGAGRPARPLAVTVAGGHGLAGMIERAMSYGGHVDAGPRPDTGWRVRAQLCFDDSTGGNDG
jgi:signal transduction histidine kinase